VKEKKRKSLARLIEGDKVAFRIEVDDAEVVRTVRDGDLQEVEVKAFKLRNRFATKVGVKEIENEAEVFLAGTLDEPVLVFRGASTQRVVCTGLSEKDRESIAAAPAEQLAETLTARSEEDRAKLANSLLHSLNESEREELLSQLASVKS
jgi:hypothetical protein